LPLPGKLYIVGIGPGSLLHLTPRAREALEGSEYILGNSTYLDQLEPLLEGKKVERSGMGREVERARRAVQLAIRGHIVSIVSGGDANIYGMAGIVYEIAEREGFQRVEVIPGITALSAAASLLGAPVTSDFAVVSLSDLLTPWQVIEKRLALASQADFVIALYNPRSRNRPGNFRRAIEVIARYREPDTPLGLVKNAARPGEKVIVTNIREAGKYEDEVDMATTVIIGNRDSRAWGERIITRRGYQRKYDY